MTSLLQNVGVVAGLPVLAGVRPYGTLFLVGLMRRLGYLESSVYFDAGELSFLDDGTVLAVFGGLFCAELIADKIPIVDHIADSLHLLGKPIVGGLLGGVGVEGITEGASSSVLGRGLGSVGGGGVALSTHGAKSSIRLMSTKFTIGAGNVVLSFLEDLVIVPGFYLAQKHPVAAGIVVIGLVVVTMWFLNKVCRALRKAYDELLLGVRKLTGIS